ncbi:DUF3616 domain-containing protein [Massilia sp. NR 4-1]|uniref:DUF3616 domain-containing protein n=1 Tax=Massilia sp. NR 4-1 TaxID=1678028 RepID=UPI00067DEF48|nr:DUF3616 domain-containing protein [Massilia sp. NR 4-1]
MAILSRLCAAASMAGLTLSASGAEPFSYKGMCEASAAAAIDAKHFVVASDESNTLLVYERENPQPVASLPLAGFLGADKSDLEGAAALGQRIYWISSHSLNKSGERKPGRYRFFAIDAQNLPLKTVGKPYVRLLDDLLKTALAQKYRLDAAAARKPEEKDGLNIEGLAAARERGLLIGFRNPLVHGRALIVPLLNPEALVADPAHAQASFGEAIELELNGLGIRSIDRIEDGYLIVAGPTGDNGDFALYRWSGNAAEQPRKLVDPGLAGLNPEALVPIPGKKNKYVLLSDDGGRCKKSDMSFRSLTIKLP